MSDIQPGDLVVLTSGSMRMAVESVDGDQISVVWCNEGTIGRDTFGAFLLKKWEVREDDAPKKSARPYKGDREGGGKPYGDREGKSYGDRDRGERSDKPRGKPGWDGKPREKKFFRKDG